MLSDINLTKLKQAIQTTILACFMVWVSASSYAVPAMSPGQFQISEESPIIMRPSPNSVLVLRDPQSNRSFSEVQTLTSEFTPASEMPRPDSSSTYWVMQRIDSTLDQDRDIQVAPIGGRAWRDVRLILLNERGEMIHDIHPAGAMRGSHDRLAELNPLIDPSRREHSQYSVFTLPRHGSVFLYMRLELDHLYGGGSYTPIYYDQIRYLEMRRLGLYIEGALAGAILALCIFGWFSAWQHRDRTSAAYAIWMTVALLSSTTQFVHDGQRLFEFFIDIEGLRYGLRFFSEVVTNTLAMAQAMAYVYFARSFLDIRERFPSFYKVTNAYLVFYAIGWIFVAIVEIRAIPQLAVIGPIVVSTFMVLIGLLVCAIIREREGMKVARFFIVALLPYLILRTVFLTNLIGIPSPFTALPDTGISFFIKEATTAQALGIALETLIMSLAVVSRTRWLQVQLANQILEQKQLVDDQNRLLEETVAIRTHELEQRHRELDASYQVVAESVNYASRLQRSQLPSRQRIGRRFQSLGTIWEPRDTIGGDLWWLSSSQHEGSFSLAVADCTGHGVPGAMLSLLVSNSLERIYSGEPDCQPVKALMSVDYLIRAALNQDSSDSESDDGCDTAILKIHSQRKIIEFAGAKIGMFQLHSDGSVEHHRPSRASLGYRQPMEESKQPELHTITVDDGDVFVIVTDGFTDQLGGEKSPSVSYGYRRLERLLANFTNATAEEIAAQMKDDLYRWQGKNNRRDDVTAVVFRL